MSCSTPGVRGTPGARHGLGGYPYELVSRPHGCWGHGANELAPPSPSMERWWAPTPLELAQKRAHHSPTATMLVAPKEDETTLQVMLLPSGFSEAIAGPSGNYTSDGAAEGTPCPLSHP